MYEDGSGLTWTSFFFIYKKNIHARIAKHSLLFNIFFLYMDTFFFSNILANYWCQQYEMFSRDSVASSGHCIWGIWVHQFELCVLPGAPSLVQRSENHWELSQGSTEGGSWFPSPLLSLSSSSNCCMWMNIVMQ
jgi:hypothetical protein